MKTIYNLGISIYDHAIKMASPFNEKARLLAHGRKESLDKISKLRINSAEKLVWFHAASLGEFEQGRPIIEALKSKNSKIQILLTFFSPSGFEVRKNYNGADYILYLPGDSSKNAKRLIETFHPDIAIFIKYEFWYNYLHELHLSNIPTFLISAIFRKEQAFFKPWGKLYREMLEFFQQIFVQDDKSVELLRNINVHHVLKTGDTRFDRVKQIADEAKIEIVEKFKNDRNCIVCGSTWSPDEDIISNYINNNFNDYKWIIVPHEIGTAHIKSIVEKIDRKVILYSKANNSDTDLKEYDVLIIDCIGLLSYIYRYAEISYIGGGFGVGIHNTLEAAVYGIPVIFGPKYHKFKEAVNLIEKGAAFSINSKDEFNDIVNTLIGDKQELQQSGNNASEYVASQLGASSTILKFITPAIRLS